MPDLRRVHRFRDHAVAGVNWRPTRFVDEVPNLRVCGLCRMIPRRILVLPCGHLLCQSCHTASSQGCRGQCPLDQEPFEEDECDSYDFPTRKANALKVYCWNEAHGCQIQETMEDMLRHYEKECTFHTVECLRCGEEVLHRELSTHYVAGCTAAVSLAVMENTSSESRSLAFVDGTADLEELKTLMRNANHEQLLLQIQCQMNDLIEQIRNQEPRPAVITHAVSASARSETAEVAASSTSTLSLDGTSQRNRTVEASSSSTSRTSRSRSKQNLIRPKAEPLVDLPRGVLQAMRKMASQDYPQHAITHTFPGVGCHLELTGPFSTTVTWRELAGTVKYVLTLANFPNSWPSIESKLADITVLHTRDAYFTLEVFRRTTSFCNLSVGTTFHGIRGDSGCPPPVFFVKAYNLRTGKIASVWAVPKECECEHHRDSWAHCGLLHRTDISLANTGRVIDGVKIEIKLCLQ